MSYISKLKNNYINLIFDICIEVTLRYSPLITCGSVYMNTVVWGLFRNRSVHSSFNNNIILLKFTY